MNTHENEIDKWNEGRRELVVMNENGGTETVIIRKLGLTALQKLQKEKSQAGKALLYVAGNRDMDWFEALVPESQLDILEIGGDLNDPLFERYFARQTKQLKAMGIDPVIQVAKAMEDAIYKEAKAGAEKNHAEDQAEVAEPHSAVQ